MRTAVAPSSRAVTIVELLIVATLFFGLLSLVTMFMVRGKRMSVRTETLSQVQNEAVKLTRKLAEDLNRGTLGGGVSGEWGNGSLIFLSSKPLDSSLGPVLEFDTASGAVVWKQWVAYYLDPTKSEVRRFSQPLPTPVSDPLLATGGWVLADLPGLPSSNGTVVALGIVEFFPTGRTLDDAMEFSVKARGEVPLGNIGEAEKIVEVAMSTMIRMGASAGP